MLNRSVPGASVLSRLTIAVSVSFMAGQAAAFNQTLNAWQGRYNPPSTSGDDASCQLCHVDANGGDPWNGYGWAIREALANPICDVNGNGTVSNDEAFFCVELDNSDNDGSGNDNATEIGLNTQPGWTNGAFNDHYFRSGLISGGHLPPDSIGTIDPDGTEPPPPPPPPPPGDDDDIAPGQQIRDTIVVRPGDSIQEAIDRAAPGTRIYVLAGVYSEPSNPTNGLNITKSGISLVGQRAAGKEVIFENAGSQRNGIVVVPPAVTECMDCHVSMAPPFEIHPWVEPGLPDPTPELYDIEVRGITIRNFDNNGLFTERVDGFKIIDVHSVNNRNYGIFPTLSRNGLITHSTSVGSDRDSGIWVETSENVTVVHNRAEGAVNGFEVSNSDDILLAHNVATNNTVGAAILLLPDIFDDRPGAKRIDMRDNHIFANNKANTARPGSILSTVPSGTGIFYLGVDDSVVENNLIEDNDFSGMLMVDYCVAVAGTPNGCDVDPSVTPEFIADNSATGNRVSANNLVDNGTNPNPFHPFAFAAADITNFSLEPSNCYEDNAFASFFSLIGILPPCP